VFSLVVAVDLISWIVGPGVVSLAAVGVGHGSPPGLCPAMYPSKGVVSPDPSSSDDAAVIVDVRLRTWPGG
jgi:hypothetical protein